MRVLRLILDVDAVAAELDTPTTEAESTDTDARDPCGEDSVAGRNWPDAAGTGSVLFEAQWREGFSPIGLTAYVKTSVAALVLGTVRLVMHQSGSLAAGRVAMLGTAAAKVWADEVTVDDALPAVGNCG